MRKQKNKNRNRNPNLPICLPGRKKKKKNVVSRSFNAGNTRRRKTRREDEGEDEAAGNATFFLYPAHSGAVVDTGQQNIRILADSDPPMPAAGDTTPPVRSSYPLLKQNTTSSIGAFQPLCIAPATSGKVTDSERENSKIKGKLFRKFLYCLYFHLIFSRLNITPITAYNCNRRKPVYLDLYKNRCSKDRYSPISVTVDIRSSPFLAAFIHVSITQTLNSYLILQDFKAEDTQSFKIPSASPFLANITGTTNKVLHYPAPDSFNSLLTDRPYRYSLI